MPWRRSRKPTTPAELSPFLGGIVESGVAEAEVVAAIHGAAAERRAIRRLEGDELVTALAIPAQVCVSLDPSTDPLLGEGAGIVERWLGGRGTPSDEEVLRLGAALETAFAETDAAIAAVTRGKHTLTAKDRKELDRLEPHKRALGTLARVLGAMARAHGLAASWIPDSPEAVANVLRFSGRNAAWALQGDPQRARALVSELVPLCFE